VPAESEAGWGGGSGAAAVGYWVWGSGSGAMVVGQWQRQLHPGGIGQWDSGRG
jgi:hypothetical protein